MAAIWVESVGNGGALVRDPGDPEVGPYYARTWGDVLRWMMDVNEVTGLDIEDDSVPRPVLAEPDTGLDHAALERTARRVVRGLRAMPRRPSAEGSDELIAGIVELEGVLLGESAEAVEGSEDG